MAIGYTMVRGGYTMFVFCISYQGFAVSWMIWMMFSLVPRPPPTVPVCTASDQNWMVGKPGNEARKCYLPLVYVLPFSPSLFVLSFTVKMYIGPLGRPADEVLLIS